MILSVPAVFVFFLVAGNKSSFSSGGTVLSVLYFLNGNRQSGFQTQRCVRMTPRCHCPLSTAPSYMLEEGHSYGATRLSQDMGLSLSPASMGQGWALQLHPGAPAVLSLPAAMKRRVLATPAVESACFRLEVNPVGLSVSTTFTGCLGPSRVCKSRRLAHSG